MKVDIESVTEQLETTCLDLGNSRAMTTPAKVDVAALASSWSPPDQRLERTLNNSFKIRSTRDGSVPMMGGDWLLDGRGSSVTLSFAFKGPVGTSNSEKIYGLTVGLIAIAHGDPIYAFSSDEVNPETGQYRVMKIGTVVSNNIGTDSLVFEFLPHIRVEPYKISLGGPTPHHLQIPDWGKLPSRPFKNGSVVVAFGAQRRGAKGVVVGRCCYHDDLLNSSDICFEACEPGMSLSDDGDCGMIYFDENGIPWAMHHAVSRSDGKYYSWGKSLAAIMASHYEYFGIDMTVHKVEIPHKRIGIEFIPGEEPNLIDYCSNLTRAAPRNLIDMIEFPRE